MWGKYVFYHQLEYSCMYIFFSVLMAENTKDITYGA